MTDLKFSAITVLPSISEFATDLNVMIKNFQPNLVILIYLICRIIKNIQKKYKCLTVEEVGKEDLHISSFRHSSPVFSPEPILQDC